MLSKQSLKRFELFYNSVIFRGDSIKLFLPAEDEVAEICTGAQCQDFSCLIGTVSEFSSTI